MGRSQGLNEQQGKKEGWGKGVTNKRPLNQPCLCLFKPFFVGTTPSVFDRRNKAVLVLDD